MGLEKDTLAGGAIGNIYMLLDSKKMVQKAKKGLWDDREVFILGILTSIYFNITTTIITVWCSEASPEQKTQNEVPEIKKLQFGAVLLWSGEKTINTWSWNLSEGFSTQVHYIQEEVSDTHCKM